MNIDLELYKAFYHVARLGNLTHAAHEMCLSQPALTKRIRQMEELFGCRLFVRLSKGMALTPEGQALFPYAARACEAIAAGEHRVQSLLGLERGEVRIGASDLILQHFLMPGIAAFRGKHPHIKISMHAAPALHLLEDIRSQRIDLAVVMQPLPPDMDGTCTVRSIGEVEDVFIAGAMFRHLAGRKVPWEELLAQPLVALGKDTATRRFQAVFFRERGLALRPMLELSNTVLIVPSVERGMGIGLTIRNFAEESLASGKTFLIDTPEPLPARTVCIVTARDDLLSVAARAFLASIPPPLCS